MSWAFSPRSSLRSCGVCLQRARPRRRRASWRCGNADRPPHPRMRLRLRPRLRLRLRPRPCLCAFKRESTLTTSPGRALLHQESYLAYEKNQNSQILLLEQIVERVLELHGSAPAPHATEAPHRHAGVVESGDRISQGFEAKLIELDQKISLILRSLYLETPRDSLPSAPRGAHRLGSSPRCAATGRAVYVRRSAHACSRRCHKYMYHTKSEHHINLYECRWCTRAFARGKQRVRKRESKT